ncbi:MAG: TonB-dependent receptor, partial [Calditrichaeota bacterium]|nr:TonB-dependent receptor [Calditrichota bacterium]
LPSENLVTLDGITLYHMDHAFGILSAVPTSIVKDVQLYKSNFPAKFGGKLSGVVEMTGKNGDFQKAHIDFETNEMAAQGMVQVPVMDYATILLSGRHSLNTYLARNLYKTINQTPPFINDFIQTTSENDVTDNPTPEITFWDTYAKISLTPTSKDLVNFSFFRSQDIMSANRGDLNAFSSREWIWSNSGLSASWFRAWDKTFQTDLQVTQSAYKINQDSSAVEGLYGASDQASRVKNSIDDFSIKLDNQWDGIKNHSFSFGYQFKKVKTDFVEWHPQFARILTHGIEAQQNIFYLQDDWQISDHLKMRPSLRITHFDLADKYFYSPRLAANYSLTKSIQLKASAGQYHQFVSNFGYEFPNYIGQLNWLVNDNTVLKPGRSNHYTIGFNWNGKLFDIDMEYYHKQSKGIIEQINTISAGNVIIPALVQRETKSNGIDVLLHHKNSVFDGWLSYSYNSSKINIPAGAPYPLSGETPHSLKAIAKYTLGSLVFAVSGYYTSGTPYSLPLIAEVGDGSYILTAPLNRNSERLPDETRVDFSLNYHYPAPWYKINLGISIYNLFDQQNTWYKNFSVQDGQLISKDVNKLGFTPTVFLRFSF